jgi:hypothetical protein
MHAAQSRWHFYISWQAGGESSFLHCRQTAACCVRLLITAIATWLIDELIFVRPTSRGPIGRLETASTSARTQTAVMPSDILPQCTYYDCLVSCW